MIIAHGPKLIVCGSPGYKVGDPAPTGYNDWHEWAGVQHRGGLRQTRCPDCGRWQFPQEMGPHMASHRHDTR